MSKKNFHFFSPDFDYILVEINYEMNLIINNFGLTRFIEMNFSFLNKLVCLNFGLLCGHVSFFDHTFLTRFSTFSQWKYSTPYSLDLQRHNSFYYQFLSSYSNKLSYFEIPNFFSKTTFFHKKQQTIETSCESHEVVQNTILFK